MEKWESFKAKLAEHKKTLQERRDVMVPLERSMAQRETEVSSVDLSFKILISRPFHQLITYFKICSAGF